MLFLEEVDERARPIELKRLSSRGETASCLTLASLFTSAVSISAGNETAAVIGLAVSAGATVFQRFNTNAILDTISGKRPISEASQSEAMSQYMDQEGLSNAHRHYV